MHLKPLHLRSLNQSHLKIILKVIENSEYLRCEKTFSKILIGSELDISFFIKLMIFWKSGGFDQAQGLSFKFKIHWRKIAKRRRTY